MRRRRIFRRLPTVAPLPFHLDAMVYLLVILTSIGIHTMAKDRTAEFHNTLLSIKSRTAVPASNNRKDESKQSLLNQGGPSKVKGKGKDEGGSKSEFGRLASGIAKDINSTTLKLQKLAQRKFPFLISY